MKFSKQALISAAVFIGSLCVAPAETITINNPNGKLTVNRNFDENYFVDARGVLTIDCKETYTMTGRFLGAAAQAGGTIMEAYDFYSLTPDNDTVLGKIVVQGGGTFEYKGFSDITYYSSTYSVRHGELFGEYEANFPTSLLTLDTNTTAFSGQLVVSGGTVFSVGGYIAQQIGFATPNENYTTVATVTPVPAEAVNVGVSNIVLEDTSTITFKGAEKNILNLNFELGENPPNLSAPAGAEPVRMLNFLTNVQASIGSTIEIGSDVASTSRIVITTTSAGGEGFDNSAEGWGGQSTIGILSGTGRVYFAGRGIVSILNQAQFLTGTDDPKDIAPSSWAHSDILDYVHSIQASYDLDISYNENPELDKSAGKELADVYFVGGSIVSLGANSFSADFSTDTNVVNNVLQTATAVQLGASTAVASQLDAGNLGTPWGHVIGNTWEVRPAYGAFAAAGNSNVGPALLAVNGVQVLNNFQSLFVEREHLIREGEAGGTAPYEITATFSSAARTNYVFNTGNSSLISPMTGSSLIINQLKNHDGIFTGAFICADEITPDVSTANDSYIYKTGDGTFVNILGVLMDESRPIINRIYVLEGQWVASASALGREGGRVIVSDLATLKIVANNNDILSARIEGGGVSDFVVARDTSYLVEDEEGNKTRVGGILNDGREFMSSENSAVMGGRGGDVTDSHNNLSSGGVIIWEEQPDFYGTVSIMEGMTLSLGYDTLTAAQVGVGDFNGSKSYELGSVFSNASQIVLSGAENEISSLTINRYQIVSNLSGDKYSAVKLPDYATLVLNSQRIGTSYLGSISGQGGIVKLGSQRLELIGGTGTAYSGSTNVLVGAVTLRGAETIAKSSGVVLKNNTSISNSTGTNSQSFAMLIGDKQAGVSMGGGTLTVGLSIRDSEALRDSVESFYDRMTAYPNYRIENPGYFFATYNGEAKYFGKDGLNLENAGITNFGANDAKDRLGFSSFGTIRPLYKASPNAALTTMTVADTIDRLKDPGDLKNAFAHLYTTIDAGVYSTISARQNWQACFGDKATTLDAFLRQAFDLETVRGFVTAEKQNAESTWTERQLNELESFAENYHYKRIDPLDGESNLTRVAYKSLSDIYAIKFLKDYYMVKNLVDQSLPEDERQEAEAAMDLQLQETLKSFYGFVTIFDPNYKFVLTDANIRLITDTYGFAPELFAGNTQEEKYAAFEKAIGIHYTAADYGPAFAGTITGEGSNLNKIGGESLTLTGINTYTGMTNVLGGELRVGWNSIASTNEINISAGALLTIVSEEILVEGLVQDNVFVVGKDGKGTIYGSGTILKDGIGTLIIESALAGKVSDASKDFTGAIVVGKGNLVVNIDDRSLLAADIYLNSDTTFELSFNELPAGEDGTPVQDNRELVFTGVLKGQGTFIKSGLGKIILESGEALANDSDVNLAVHGGNMTIRLDAANSVMNTFRNENFTVELAQDSSFTFDVAQGETWHFSGLLRTSGTGTNFSKTGAGTLDLNRAIAPGWNIDSLRIDAGNLVIASGSTYKFKEINSAEGTTFNVSGILDLDIADGERSLLAGTFNGSGTLVKDGAGTLEISGDNDFSGNLSFDAGTVVLNVEKDADGNFEISGDATSSRTLVKTGAGVLTLKENIASGMDFKIEEGRLSVSGIDFTSAKVLLIEKGAAFEISPSSDVGDPTSEFDINTRFESIKGGGILSFGKGKITLSSSDRISEFSGVIEVQKNATLSLTGTITSFNGIAGEGSLQIAAEDFVFKQTSDGAFTGALEGNATDFVLTGPGVLNLATSSGERISFSNIKSFQVGSGSEVGHVGIALDQTLADKDNGSFIPFTVVANGSSISIVDALTPTGKKSVDQAINVEVGTGKLGVRAHGEITFSETYGLGNLLRLVGVDPTTLKFTLANNGASGENLIVKGLESLQKYHTNVSLATVAGSNLVLDTSDVLSGKIDIAQDIGGSGGLEKIGAGMVTLTKNQSYTSETKIKSGTLAFSAGTTLRTSGITVAGGATLKGGVTLATQSASVVFGEKYVPATYQADLGAGEFISYGNKIEGNVDLLLSTKTATRGVAYNIFKYTGTTAPTNLLETKLLTIQLDPNSDRVFIDELSLASGNLVVYAAQDYLSNVAGVEIHDGLDGFVDLLSVWARPDATGFLAGTPEQKAIGEAINKTSNADLTSVLNNLSPLGYASMISMVHTSFTSDVRSISGRLQYRLYDNAAEAWDYRSDWEFFAQAQGTDVSNSNDRDSMTYDYNTYGALAGFDCKLSLENTVGFAVGYDHGKASFHDSGGSVESDGLRVTGFFGTMVGESLSLNMGAQFGYSTYDAKRNTIMGRNTGDTKGWHTGLFIDATGVLPLAGTDSDDYRLDLMPHAGVSASYYGVGGFNESGSVSKLNLADFDAVSLQGRVGATLTWTLAGEVTCVRTTLDVSAIHEFADDEIDIESSILGAASKVSAKGMSNTSFAVSPGISVDLDSSMSIYFNYEFRAGTESEISHSANIGFRKRF